MSVCSLLDIIFDEIAVLVLDKSCREEADDQYNNQSNNFKDRMRKRVAREMGERW